MLVPRRSLEFEWAFTKNCWRLVRAQVDWEVAKLLGPILMNYPRVIKVPLSPQYFVARVFLALAQHKLDGGYVYEVHDELDPNRYSVTIVVDGRREKLKH
jgi:hypothetical protein